MQEQVEEVKELLFDASGHEYRLGGKTIPSVTQVLSACGIIETQWFREDATWRGSVVHRVCELDDLDDLQESTVAEEARGYLAAYRRFKREMIFRPTVIEQPMYSERLGCAGTPDRIGLISCRRGPDYEAVLDLKTGTMTPWHRIQLAPYSEMAGVLGRIVLRLKPDGSYNVKEFPIAERRRDLELFQYAIAIHNFKEENR